MKKNNPLLALALLCFAATAYAEPVVIEGKIAEMVPSKKEIYVVSNEQRFEFYFNPKTRVTSKGEERTYDDLSEGMQVKVAAEKIGRRYDPISVEIRE